MEDLAQKISSLILDYGNGQFGRLDADHVIRWVMQFEEDDRLVVLQETNRILKNNYITRASFQDYIATLVASEKFAGGNLHSFWSTVSLLNIQQKGNSQSELVGLLSQQVGDNFGLPPSINSNSSSFIYIDDFLFSGSRLVNDMRAWIEASSPQKCHVDVVFMGWYQSGIWYAQKALKGIAEKCKKDITFKYWTKDGFKLENRLFRKDFSHVFWPDNTILEHQGAREYISGFKREISLRSPNNEKNQIFSRSRRSQYENAMVKAGLQILSFCDNPSPVMKPLGFNPFEGFGFGSTVFSFRNCPNNNPLAFWWGDPKQPYTTLGRWYPLMQRITYE